MDAFVMAGGSASRMGGVEKPMLLLEGKPMVDHVIEALLGSMSIGKVYVIISGKVPRTTGHINETYQTEKRVEAVMTPGSGYVEDTVTAVKSLSMYRPFLITSSDIPLLSPVAIDTIVEAYIASGKEALSVRVEPSSLEGTGITYDIVLTDTGVETIPVGVNVVHGAFMHRAQEEAVLLIKDAGLALNVNYKKDMALFESMRNAGPNR